MLIWAYPPKSHWTAWAVEDARFDFVQKLIHVFATGKNPGFVVSASDFPEFAGFSTTVRPSFEEWLLVRKPREGTVVENLKQWGVGALNVPACRVEGGPGQPPRFPGTLIHDGSDEVLALFPEAPGQLAKLRGDGADMNNHVYGKMKHGLVAKPPRVDNSTSASRFFLQYCAKASKMDQNEGLSNGMNSHPTVKPTMLMRIFARLVTPPGGIVLDPFSGSGSTGKAAMLEGLRFLGCDQSAEYVAIANARISHALASTESQQIAKPPDNG